MFSAFMAWFPCGMPWWFPGLCPELGGSSGQDLAPALLPVTRLGIRMGFEWDLSRNISGIAHKGDMGY
jgi:hypothetical protein